MERQSCFIDWIVNLNWTVIFNGLSAVATALLLICTVIGFIYIKKQISIAKNKDIFFNLQQNLESELNYFFKKNFDFMSECDELINNFIRKHPIYIFENGIPIDVRKKVKKNRLDYLKQNSWDIFKKSQKVFYTKKINLDRWWLDKHYNDLLNLKNSFEYQNHINFTGNLFEKLKSSFEEDIDDITSLKDILYSEYIKSVANSEKIEKNISEFLTVLAKDKGIL